MNEVIERRVAQYGSKIFLIIYSLLFIAFLLGLIGFNLLPLLSSTNILLVLVIELGKCFAFPINVFLVIMLGGITIPFISVWRRFLTYLSPKNKIKYSIPEVEDRILQILTEHKGKSLSRLDLVRKAKFPGNLKEFTEILNRLWQEEKIKREFQDYPKYSAI